MIRLAHFAAARNYPRPWVAISNGVPGWITVDEHRKDLAPDWADVEAAKAGKMPLKRFVERYWSQLNALAGFSDDSLELPEDCTCLCYEKPGDFCHRRILGAFLVRHGFRVDLDGREIDKGFRILEGI